MKRLTDRIPLSAQAAVMRAVVKLPRRLRRMVAGKPIRIDGHTLALDAQVLLRLHRLSGTKLAGPDPTAARADLDAAAGIASGARIEPVATRELSIPTPEGSIGARLYSPEGLEDPAPLLVYYHGGGFVLGTLDTHDNTARLLAKYAGVRVLSVAYRLAPEHRFPAGIEDAVAAFDYAHKNSTELGIDPERIAVGGDSAGGNLAAVVAQQTTFRGGPAPAFQLLIYPETDFSVRRRSRQLFAEGFFLTSADMDWFEGHYLPAGADKTDPRISPLRADDLTGLPPACVITAGFDPLRDGGDAYAEALAKAEVPVVHREFSDQIHGFVNFLGAGPSFTEATLEIAAELRTGLAKT